MDFVSDVVYELTIRFPVALLYVHRAFFAQGLCDHPADPLRGTYAPSILSGYRSACQILSNLRAAFAIFPSRVARFWVLWTHAFSASVIPLSSSYSLASAHLRIKGHACPDPGASTAE